MQEWNGILYYCCPWNPRNFGNLGLFWHDPRASILRADLWSLIICDPRMARKIKALDPKHPVGIAIAGCDPFLVTIVNPFWAPGVKGGPFWDSGILSHGSYMSRWISIQGSSCRNLPKFALKLTSWAWTSTVGSSDVDAHNPWCL